MRRTAQIMGMSVTIGIVDASAWAAAAASRALDLLRDVDQRLSPFKPDSELSRYNRGELAEADLSRMPRTALALARETHRQTDGYFDIRRPDGSLDPSGLVKGWAIHEAARIVAERGFTDYFVEAGEDIQTSGRNFDGRPWAVGVRDPFHPDRLGFSVHLSGQGIATSGTYRQGGHIYDPHTGQARTEVVGCTVVGPDVYEADRFATAACAMGERGVGLLERRPDLEGRLTLRDGREWETSGFAAYRAEAVTR